jgi:phosphoglycolate phosphatase
VPVQASSSADGPARAGEVFVRPGFVWNAADAYLFDIDGTLLNSRDAVHYFAFQSALKSVFGVAARIDGVPVHGNTDLGILRAVLRREGIADHEIDSRMPQMVAEMCADAERNREQLQPEVCPSIKELLTLLHGQGKLLGAASGNLETIGWLKLEKAGLRSLFSFGSFSFPREPRVDIFRHGIEHARKVLGPDATVCVVGDTPADIQAARAAGVPVIAIATGVYKFADLRSQEPDACLTCAADLLKL